MSTAASFQIHFLRTIPSRSRWQPASSHHPTHQTLRHQQPRHRHLRLREALRGGPRLSTASSTPGISWAAFRRQRPWPWTCFRSGFARIFPVLRRKLPRLHQQWPVFLAPWAAFRNLWCLWADAPSLACTPSSITSPPPASPQSPAAAARSRRRRMLFLRRAAIRESYSDPHSHAQSNFSTPVLLGHFRVVAAGLADFDLALVVGMAWVFYLIVAEKWKENSLFCWFLSQKGLILSKCIFVCLII